MRVLFLSLLTGLSLAGLTACAPADPLDAKVKASTPNAYVEWRNGIEEKYPQELREEIDVAFNNLAAVTPGPNAFSQPFERNHPLFRRIDHRTVRAMILDSYDATANYLQQQISAASETVTRESQTLLQPGFDVGLRDRTSRKIESDRKQIEAYQKSLQDLAEKRKRFGSPKP